MDNPLVYLHTPPPPARADPETPDNWAILNQRGFVKLGDERILFKLGSRISCDLSVPQDLEARYAPFQRKSNKGTLFLTNKRIVYLPSKPTQEPKFESFSAPVLNFQDSSTSSPIFFGNCEWKSDCIPVPGEDIPSDLPKIEVKFTFSGGGMMEFNEEYTELIKRLLYYQALRSQMGLGADTPDEPLPAYDGPGANPPGSTTTLTVPRTNRSDSSSSRRAPDEPPPGYDEAQAQQISMRLEDHIRGEVDRGATDE